MRSILLLYFSQTNEYKCVDDIMKKYKIPIRFLLVAVFIGIAITFSCQKDDDVIDDNNPDDGANSVGLNEESVFIDTTKTLIEILGVDSVTASKPIYDIEIIGDNSGIKNGTVIADTRGDGSIWIVVEVSDLKNSKEQGKYKVIKGTLDVLFPESSLKFSSYSNRAKENSSLPNKLTSGQFAITGKDKEIYPLEDFKLLFEFIDVDLVDVEEIVYDQKIEFDFTGKQINLGSNIEVLIEEGKVVIDPSIDLLMDFRNPSLINAVLGFDAMVMAGSITYAQSTIYTSVDFDFKAKITSHVSAPIEYEETFARYIMIFPVGYLFVSAEVDLKLKFTLDAGGYIEINPEFHSKKDFVLRSEYEGGFKKPTFEYDTAQVLNEMSNSIAGGINLTQRLEIIPDVEVYAYGLIGLNSEVVAFEEMIINASKNIGPVLWDVNIDLGLGASGSVDISLFHFDGPTLPITKWDFGPEKRWNIYKAPNSLEIISGNNQIGKANSWLQDPIVINVKDKLGYSLPYVPVFYDTNGNGSCENEWEYTDLEGNSENEWRIGNNVGEQKSTVYLKDGVGNIIITSQKEVIATVENSDHETGTVTDSEGNTYKTVKIGNQWWMAENLKSTQYADGTVIPHVKENSSWALLNNDNTDRAYCFYDNDESLGYGALYTFAAAVNGIPHNGINYVQGVCPDGWHVPNDTEWIELENYLIANGYNYDGTTSGNKIGKSLASTTGWSSSSVIGDIGNNLSTNNSSGFTALPGGSRFSNGAFHNSGRYGSWWCSSEFNMISGYSRSMSYHSHRLANDYDCEYYKSNGFSVRCLRD